MFGRIKSKLIGIGKSVYVRQKTIHIKINTAELFISQNRDRDFQRYDIVVRYLFIEEYFGKNDIGFKLYEKMQKAREGKSFDPLCLDKFEDLIKSYSENGYEDKSEILLGNSLQLIDGSHRIAASLYFNQSFISAAFTPMRTEYDYSIEWFIAHDFSEEEIDCIKKKYSELERRCNSAFQCIIWPPMEQYFDDATADLEKMETVIGYQDYTYTKEQFEFFIKGVYAVDDIENWKIEKKIENMTDAGDYYRVRILDLHMRRPDYRLKQVNNKTISRRGEQLKSAIRTKYSAKISHYYYDNVMHIADNSTQNHHIELLKDFEMDISEFFKSIEDEKYVVTKLDAPYMPKDFPKNVPLGKDIDVLCFHESLERLGEAAEKFCAVYALQYNCVRRVLGADRIQIRLELNGYTLFIWDFACREEGLNDAFIKDAVQDYDTSDYIKCIKPEYEVIYRRNILKHKPKAYHEEWICNHMDLLDSEKEKLYQA